MVERHVVQHTNFSLGLPHCKEVSLDPILNFKLRWFTIYFINNNVWENWGCVWGGFTTQCWLYIYTYLIYNMYCRVVFGSVGQCIVSFVFVLRAYYYVRLYVCMVCNVMYCNITQCNVCVYIYTYCISIYIYIYTHTQYMYICVQFSHSHFVDLFVPGHPGSRERTVDDGSGQG